MGCVRERTEGVGRVGALGANIESVERAASCVWVPQAWVCCRGVLSLSVGR